MRKTVIFDFKDVLPGYFESNYDYMSLVTNGEIKSLVGKALHHCLCSFLSSTAGCRTSYVQV